MKKNIGKNLRLPTSWVGLKMVVIAQPLEGSRNNFESFIHSHSSSNPANFAKTGPVYVKITGLTEITK